MPTSVLQRCASARDDPAPLGGLGCAAPARPAAFQATARGVHGLSRGCATLYGYARMKTLTELSGSLIRTAAAAIAEARRSLPAERAPEAPPVPDTNAQSTPAEPASDAAAAGPAEASAAPEIPPPAPAP